MNTLLAIHTIVSDQAHAAADGATNLIAAAGDGTGQRLWDAVKAFIQPVVLAVIAVIALTFLVRRQVSQFLQFVALAVGVLVIFNSPTIIEGVANFFASKA